MLNQSFTCWCLCHHLWLCFFFSFNLYMHHGIDSFMSNILCHLFEHIVSNELVLNYWVFLCVCLKSNAFSKLLHVVDVIHPFAVDYFKKNNSFNFSDSIVVKSCVLLSKFYIIWTIYLCEFIELFLFLVVDF